MRSLRLRETSALFNTLDGVADFDAQDARLQVLRTIQPACVHPDVPVTKGQTSRFGTARIAQLRLLQALASLLPPRAIRRLNGFLTTTAETGQPSPQPSMIEAAVAGTAAGEEWTFSRARALARSGESANVPGPEIAPARADGAEAR